MNDTKKKDHVSLITLTILAVLVFSCAFSLIISSQGLTTSHYQVSSEKLTGSFRVVSLADIHGTVFGKDNQRLVRRVAAESPDLILIPGDLINKYDTDTSAEEDLIKALSEIAPVYISPGNHEQEYDRDNGLAKKKSVMNRFKRAGATVLDQTYVDLEINGASIRLGGLYGYCMPEELATGWMRDELPYLEEFQNTDRFTVLLCHMPFSFLVTKGLDKWDFDTVLSGHVHGGQVRFPFLGLLSKYKFGKEDQTFPYWGGLWAPDQGRFPGRLEGVYSSTDGERTMILSRGLGNTDGLPRFNNIPEIVVVDYGP